MAFRRTPPTTNGLIDGTNLNRPTSVWARWFLDVFREQDAISKETKMAFIEATISAVTLDSGSDIVLYTPLTTTETFKVRNLLLIPDGTNFKSTGDRDVTIVTSISLLSYSIIPAATLKTIAGGLWGDTALPFPSTASTTLSTTAVTEKLLAKYSGGATSYGSVGSIKVLITIERVTV